MGTVGIPVKLLHEAVGHTITIELKGGVTYRGRLFDAEDNFNISMKDIAVTARDGKQTHLDSVYIRGNMVRFMSSQICCNRPRCLSVSARTR